MALIVLSLLCALIGLVMPTQATNDVGFAAFACLFAILARIAQAEAHQNRLLDYLGKRSMS